ncbi:SseB family protein [Amycolatopsis taiwanensis]|uniref:SseB family protein n=1 Tax=Amycolatopsis taiwanensis TaxID=342230 RepID=UPI00048A3951|nr:SseB family protein [Amycolatopsis taiwanensis]
MESVWQPANEIERELVRALEEEDSKRYAEIVLSAPLYLPVLPESGTPEWHELMRLLPMDDPHVIAYTSAETLAEVLGRFTRGHVETTYHAMAAGWPPEAGLSLALNPGLPIGFAGSVEAIYQLAEGRESLVAITDLQDAVLAEARTQIRQGVLAELGGGPPESAPANPLENELAEAIGKQDQEGYLAALLGGQVVVPTTEQVPGPAAIDAPGFPWQVRKIRDLPVITLFSSSAMMARIAPSVRHSLVVPFLGVIGNWPDDEHALCFNPGADSELILTGDGVMDLVGQVAEVLQAESGAGR